MTTIDEILKAYKRIGITGGPGTGKTTLASTIDDRAVFHTDSNISLPWDDQPYAAKAMVKHSNRFIIEGVHVASAILVGLEVDAVLYLRQPYIQWNAPQEHLARMIHRWLGAINTPIIEL